MNPTPNRINPQSGFIPRNGVPLPPGIGPFMPGLQPIPPPPPHFVNYPSYGYNSFLRTSYPYPPIPGAYLPPPPPIPFPVYSNPISNNASI
ncbi:hypothetical protein BLA29_004673, partial [Euroglyphus maynei]